MKHAALILLAVLPLGCARHAPPAAPPPVGPTAATSETGVTRVRTPAVATGLVFAPVALENSPEPRLARDLRTPAAFVGYDSVTVTSFYLRVDDRQHPDWTGRGGRWDGFSRRAVTVRTGTSTR